VDFTVVYKKLKIYDIIPRNALFLLGFRTTWIFSTDFRKILKYQISWKSFQLLCADKRTDGRRDGQTWRS